MGQAKHDDIKHRWTVRQLGDPDIDIFTMKSAKDGTNIQSDLQLGQDPKVNAHFSIQSLGTGNGYSLVTALDKGLSVDSSGKLSSVIEKDKGFSLFAVTYHK